MKRTRKVTKPVSAEVIARLADRDQDISGLFKGQGRMVEPIQRVNLLRQALDQHYMAQRARQPQSRS
jgi:hypothetical protein